MISHRSQSYSYWTKSEGGREVISHYRHQSESCYYMFVIHKNVCHVYSTHDNINIIKNAEITYPLVASGSQYLEFIQGYATVQDFYRLQGTTSILQRLCSRTYNVHMNVICVRLYYYIIMYYVYTTYEYKVVRW